MSGQPQSDTKSINYKKRVYHLVYKDEINNGGIKNDWYVFRGC